MNFDALRVQRLTMHPKIRDIARACPPANNWALPAIPPGCSFASLTELLADFSALESALLPNSRRAITEINKTIGQRPYIGPCSVTRDGKLYGRIGLAVDRAALFLSGVDIAAEPRATLCAGDKLERSMAALLKAWQPRAKGMFHSRAAIGWLYVLGGLDSVLRGFMPLSDVVRHQLPRRIKSENAKK